MGTERFQMNLRSAYPIMTDRTSNTFFDTHYVYHTAWALRKLMEIRPEKHIDIGSSLYFSAMGSALCPMEVLDYRPPIISLPGLEVGKCDLCHLEFEDDSIGSLSCMHVVEHIGLGRYGDPIDYDGDLKAISELKRVVKRGGNLLFVVPVGKPKIMFNAHRIYSYDQVVDAFDGFELKELYLIPDPDKGSGPMADATREVVDNQDYGCGCFWFQKG
jgi:SAM-dependent methyltransferase